MIRARPGALLVRFVIAGPVALGLHATSAAVVTATPVPQGSQERAAFLVLVRDATFGSLLTSPDVAALARAGGAALLANVHEVDGLDGAPIAGLNVAVLDADDVEEAGALRSLLERSQTGGARPPDEVLVLVVGATLRPPTAAGAGIVMARGDPPTLFADEGEPGALTSGSTRRDGVVTGADVGATVRAFLGGAGAEQAPGAPIGVVDGPAPFPLHDRYLAQRRMYVPIGTAAALYVTGAGLAAIACLVWRGRIPVGWRRVAGWASLTVPMLAVGLLAAGHLPELTYATAVPMVAIVTVFGTMAFSPLERDAVTAVPAAIGAAVLGCFVVEAFLGWSGMLTPLLGGSQLDGGRFYGLPNVAIGLLVGATAWAAHRLTTAVGVALFAAVALLSGLPVAGANLGAAVTLFAAAGLWLAVRERERLGLWRGLAIAATIAAVGTAAILLGHAVSPVATHVTRFGREVDGVAGVAERYLDRMQVGFDLIARSPAALVPVVGTLVLLVVLWRPPAPIRDAFARFPSWRDAIVVTTVAAVVAYIANDSGPAAAGLAFGLALGGTLGVSLLVGTRKMEER